MPFTFSHPFIVLALPRRYFHFPALILGAMSPDFIYFLSGKPVSGGHQILQSAWLNLPLCLLFYAVYITLLQPPWQRFLPDCLNYHYPSRPFTSYGRWLSVFLYSAWLGMISHIVLDDFTHPTGYFVGQFEWLKLIYSGLPLYKWLQYTGSLLGGGIVLLYVIGMAYRYPFRSATSAKAKWCYWLGHFILVGLLWLVWFALAPVKFAWLGIWIIRWIDCCFILFIISGLFFRIFAKSP